MKSAISVFALTVGMLAAPAFAQDAAKTIAGNPVLEADVVAVQSKCDELALADATKSEATDATDAEEMHPEKPEAEGLDNALTTIDLNTITLQNCKDGGWVM